MTGSDTSTNALFGKLQAVTAEKIGIDPVIAMSANTCGGVCGKMISPQSISVATGSTGMVGRESEIFRFTFKHSIAMAIVVGILHLLLEPLPALKYCDAGLEGHARLGRAGALLACRVLAQESRRRGFFHFLITKKTTGVLLVETKHFQTKQTSKVVAFQLLLVSPFKPV
jgi:hypothetical protein